MLRIRQTNGLDVSIADSTSLLRAETYISSAGFSWAFAGRRPYKDKQETEKANDGWTVSTPQGARVPLKVSTSVLLHIREMRADQGEGVRQFKPKVLSHLFRYACSDLSRPVLKIT